MNEKYECPECGGKFRRQGLGPHRAKAHGIRGAGSTLKILDAKNYDLENAIQQIMSEPDTVTACIAVQIEAREREVKEQEEKLASLRVGIERLKRLGELLMNEDNLPFKAENVVGKAS